MYLIYKRSDGVIEDCIYKELSDGIIAVATGGDFRKGYITLTKEEFEKVFISNTIKMLKHKPKKKVSK